MTQDHNLDNFYQYVQSEGKLRTEEHARRWTVATLRTLGTALDGRSKKRLARALPSELGKWLNDIFWLLHFRNPRLSQADFLKGVARRSGNSDFQFAPFPVRAVFGAIQQVIDEDLGQAIGEALSPEMRELWQQP